MFRIVLFGTALVCSARLHAQAQPASPPPPSTQSAVLAEDAPSTKTLQQIPHLRALPDETDRLQREIDQAGRIELTRPFTRITRPLQFDLQRVGPALVHASVGATLIMDGPGPAIRIVGTHTGTASPKTFKPGTWNQRMPILRGIEILGNHPMADGIELDSTVGPVIAQTSIRWCRHAIHLVNRNRNVIVDDCHLYENTGIGIYLDDVNLHQINVSNSHISYNRGGGVVVRDGNVRNVQVTGCDVEANMPADETETRTANILFDVTGSAGDVKRSIAEISITGCTIQHSANYSGHEQKTIAPGGANVRLAGKPAYPIDSVTITGNVLSDTTINIDISHAMDVAIQANNFFAPKPTSLQVADSHRVVVVGNTFNPRQFQRPGTIRFIRSNDCVLANSTIHRSETSDGAVVLEDCTGMMLTGLRLTECASGIVLKRSRDCTIGLCRISGTAQGQHDLVVSDSNRAIELIGNHFQNGARVDDAAIAKSAP